MAKRNHTVVWIGVEVVLFICATLAGLELIDWVLGKLTLQGGHSLQETGIYIYIAIRLIYFTLLRGFHQEGVYEEKKLGTILSANAVIAFILSLHHPFVGFGVKFVITDFIWNSSIFLLWQKIFTWRRTTID